MNRVNFNIRSILKKFREQRGGVTGEKGQIAIFVALIFQVLFVFFAMVVNVGLMVHHKINLQNSVDLAAYYGAMKQAEVLNAVGHMNYQIRQSYKLLIWRYRHLGMAGDTFNHPFDSLGGQLRGAASVDQPFRAADGSSCKASFCVNFPVFDIQEPNEYYCRDMCKGVKINLLGIPQVSGINFGLAEGVLGGLARSIEEASKQLVDKTKKHCRNRSALNWFALARFIVSYRQDVMARKTSINMLANSISATKDDLKDIDGGSVRKGALETLYRNLSYPNQESIDPSTGAKAGGKFEFYNSLGHASCGGVEGEHRVPPKWLNEVIIRPIFHYLEGICDGSDSIGYAAKLMNSGDANFSAPKYQDGLDPQTVQDLVRLMGEPTDTTVPENRLWASTIGYEKNPWCMAYVAVDAATQPKVPFNPFGPVKITARAFAKPFGGRIGPWFYSKWPSGDNASRGGMSDRIDSLIPVRVVNGENIPSYDEASLDMDFSRYTGDKVGTKSSMTMGYVSKGIWDKHRPPQQASWNMYGYLLMGGASVGDPGNSGDIMAWDALANTAPTMRDMELSFIVPDQFDVTYYSIEPDFWRNYALRLQKRPDFSNIHVRGDLGYRKGAGAPWGTMTIQDQIERVRNLKLYNFDTPLTYYIGAQREPAQAFVETLTSWHMNLPGDYSLVKKRFGNCPPGGVIPDGNTEFDQAVPGNCITGGRTGYSVKLVDGEYLQSQSLEIGGAGISGPLKNAWEE